MVHVACPHELSERAQALRTTGPRAPLSRISAPARTGCSVAIGEPMTFTALLCPTDFSAGPQLATRSAAMIAARTSAELVLAHVISMPSMAFANELALSPSMIQG